MSSALDPFPSTHWTLVAQAGRESGEAKRQALGQLLHRYIGPMRSHLIVRHRVPPDRADDLVQGFLASQVLERDLIQRAQKECGRFRTFLLVALRRYAQNQARHEQSGRCAAVNGRPLSAAEGGDWEPECPAAQPDEVFDLRWARAVLDEAVRRMRHLCTVLSRPDVWGVFDARVLGPAFDGAEPLDYAALVRRFHFTSPSQASNVLVTSKRMFTRCLRSVIAEYELDEAEIGREIDDLREILSRGSGGKR